jgi:hypothetical protein
MIKQSITARDVPRRPGDLYAAAADGTDVLQITDTPDFENGPDWGR